MTNQDLHTTNDQKLFALIAEGDEQAFRQIFHFYTPLLQPLILNIIQSEASVKDVVQEIFCTCEEAIKSCRIRRLFLFIRTLVK